MPKAARQLGSLGVWIANADGNCAICAGKLENGISAAGVLEAGA